MKILRAINGTRTSSTRIPVLVVALVACLLPFTSNTLRFLLKADQMLLFEHELKMDAPLNVNVNVNVNMPNTNTVSNTVSVNNGNSNNEPSFSACILWMDDNHRLEEWLAYHYYLLKLRYVVINIDPWSKTSPQPIIDRWNDKQNKYNLNMTIVVMNDKDYVQNYSDKLQEIENKSLSTEDTSTDTDAAYKHGIAKTAYHRSRQVQFYKACSNHLVEQNKTWTSFHDTDEFITFEHKFKNKDTNTSMSIDISQESAKKMESPGYVWDRLNEIKRQLPPNTHFNDTGLSCLVVDRKLLVAKELSTDETNNMFLPSSSSTSSNNDAYNDAFGVIPEGFFNSSSSTTTENDRESIVKKFETLRYKYIHGKHGKTGGMPKSVIDLSQPNPQLYLNNQWQLVTDADDFKGTSHRWSAHKVMKQLCTKEERNRLENIETLVQEERFIIHHYLGSFESYSFRDDARKGGLRSYEVWKERSNDTLGDYSHVVRPWLRGFVDLVGGPKVASYLLQDAGRFPEDYNLELRIDQLKTTYDHNKEIRTPRRKNGKKEKRKRKKKETKKENGKLQRRIE